MSVYVITGVSKGIGFELVKQISENPNDLVIGLVRGKTATEEKVSKELGNRSNVHILHGDLTSYASLKQAALDTTKIVGDRGIDYLVANGAYLSYFDAFVPLSALGDKPDELEGAAKEAFQTNVTGNIHLFNLFLPLVMKGKIKKVISISSGHADLDLINSLELGASSLYAASKAAINVIVAKYSAQYKNDGVLFVSISPGFINSGNLDKVPPEHAESIMGVMAKFQTYAPDFKGPTPLDEGVQTLRSTWEKISIEGGFAGAFISHFGNKQWL